MKVMIAILLINLFCPSNYTINAVAVPELSGTAYYCDSGHIFCDYDRHSGSVVLVMDSYGTENVTDDEIIAVIER